MGDKREFKKEKHDTGTNPWSSDDDDDSPALSNPRSDPISRQSLLRQRPSTSGQRNVPHNTYPGASGTTSTLRNQPTRNQLLRSQPLRNQPLTNPPLASQPTEGTHFWSFQNNDCCFAQPCNMHRLKRASANNSANEERPPDGRVNAESLRAPLKILELKKALRQLTELNDRGTPTMENWRNLALSLSQGQDNANEKTALIVSEKHKFGALIRTRRVPRTRNDVQNSQAASQEPVAGCSRRPPPDDGAVPSTSALTAPPSRFDTSNLNRPPSRFCAHHNNNQEDDDDVIEINANASSENDHVEEPTVESTSPPAAVRSAPPAEMTLEEVVLVAPDQNTTDTHDTSDTPAAAEPSTSTLHEQTPRGVKRKIDEPRYRGSEVTVEDLNKCLLRLLECPVCLEWMEPPMCQCRRGHLVCVRCRARLSSCPVCRTSFSSVRNRAMEEVSEMIRYPCRHGCGVEVRLRRRAGHESSCPNRRHVCPASSCLNRPPMPYDQLTAHFQSKHPSMLKIGRKLSIPVKVNVEQRENWMILALNEIFHLRLDVDVRTWSIHLYVAYIGAKVNSKKYTYEVTVDGKHNSRRLVYTRNTHSDLESFSTNISRHDCFHLSLEQALNFLRINTRSSESVNFLNFNVVLSNAEAVDETEDTS